MAASLAPANIIYPRGIGIIWPVKVETACLDEFSQLEIFQLRLSCRDNYLLGKIVLSPIESRFIDYSEAHLGLWFPEFFKKGMKEYNGGEIETPEDVWFLYPFFDMSDRKQLLRTADHIVIETAFSKELPGYPEGAVTIGSNKYGDLLVLLPEGNSLKDVVYKWDRKTEKLSVIWPTTEILMNSRM